MSQASSVFLRTVVERYRLGKPQGDQKVGRSPIWARSSHRFRVRLPQPVLRHRNQQRQTWKSIFAVAATLASRCKQLPLAGQVPFLILRADVFITSGFSNYCCIVWCLRQLRCWMLCNARGETWKHLVVASLILQPYIKSIHKVCNRDRLFYIDIISAYIVIYYHDQSMFKFLHLSLARHSWQNSISSFEFEIFTWELDQVTSNHL